MELLSILGIFSLVVILLLAFFIAGVAFVFDMLRKLINMLFHNKKD